MKGLRTATSLGFRPTTLAFGLRTTTSRIAQRRCLSATLPLYQAQAQPERPVNVSKTHGRALFKVLTLAFLTYQIAYWAWLTVETEEIKDQKNREIKALEREVRLLDESRKAQKTGG